MFDAASLIPDKVWTVAMGGLPTASPCGSPGAGRNAAAGASTRSISKDRRTAASGAGILNLQRRFGEDGGVVGELRGHHSGDGEHGGVLDTALRCAGTTRGDALFGGRPGHEKRAGAAHGLARMPVDPISAFGRLVAGGISTGRRCLRGAVTDAAPQRIGADGRPTYPAHAEGPDADESADP